MSELSSITTAYAIDGTGAAALLALLPVVCNLVNCLLKVETYSGHWNVVDLFVCTLFGNEAVTVETLPGLE